MARNDWGCEECRNERYTLEFDTIKLIAASRSKPFGVYRCSNCGEWLEWDWNGRLYVLTDEQAAAAITRWNKDGQ